MDKNIVFVSEMRDPYLDASSTQIMTENLLHGFKSIASKLVFVVLINANCDKDNIIKYYGDYVDQIVFVYKRHFNNKYLALLNTISVCVINDYGTIGKAIADQYINDNTYLVSQSPSIEPALLCKYIRKHIKPKKYIQYWGDPLALSLITPEQISWKRYAYLYIEKYLHSFADSVVYGTKPLFQSELSLFPKESDKLSYCDVCYSSHYNDFNKVYPNHTYGYLGNYYSNIRDICPLYSAFKQYDGKGKLMIVGSGDIELKEKNNISVLDRIPQSSIHEIEKMIGIEICILNRIGTQIPGKLFYQTNTNKIILVLLDGPKKSEIRDYLSSFNRFIFCENNEDSILKVLKEGFSKYNIDKSEMYRLSPAYVANSIINGGFKE